MRVATLISVYSYSLLATLMNTLPSPTKFRPFPKLAIDLR